MLKFEQQRGASDCGVACLSMIADIPYEDVVVVLNNLNISFEKGLTFLDCKAALAKWGFYTEDIVVLDTTAFGGGVYLVQTPSLNNMSGYHFVVFEMHAEEDKWVSQVLDPQQGREGFNIYARDTPLWGLPIIRCIKVMGGSPSEHLN